ncbi:MAG: BMP family ABC transporter substrate-binding protein [Pseudomonadota bacterium]
MRISASLVSVILVLMFVPSVQAKEFKVGVVFDKAGKDDKSFNMLANEAALRAQKELGVSVKTSEPPDDASYEPSLEMMAKRGYDLVIAVGFAQKEAIERVAKRNPNSRFAIVDGRIEQLANVASLMFEEQEGSFLVGMIAALKSKSNIVGFVGGMDIPLIRRFEKAYIQGARYAKPKVKVISNFAGVTIDAFNDPTKGKELANSQIAQGADVVFHAAGSTGLGVFGAVDSKSTPDKPVYAIGVDANQNWIKPGKVLTSMLKRVDVAVYDTIKATKEGKFKGGVQTFDLKNGGIDYALDKYNDALVDAGIRAKVVAAKKEIIAGTLKVVDAYKRP